MFSSDTTRVGSATTTQRNSGFSINRPGRDGSPGITIKSPSTYDRRVVGDDVNRSKGKIGQAK
jgi:hypothetical protein